MDEAKLAQTRGYALTGSSGHITRHRRLAMAWGDLRAMYELKSTTKSSGSIPVWTTAVNRRGAVLTRPSRWYRSSVSYNADLKRYLWVQTGLGEDTRFAGALAIYDATDA